MTGEERRFRFFEGVAQQELKDVDRRIMLPITLQNTRHQAAIALLVERDDAEKLAASMFGVSRQDLLEADIADACAEACNVLSGAIVDYLSANDQVEIGLPKSVEAAGYQSVLLTSVIKAYSEGRSDNHQLTLVIFDPLIESKHQENV
ncbi:MAG: chemotaxis protein CheX [Betaproteobacteria bacterium]